MSAESAERLPLFLVDGHNVIHAWPELRVQLRQGGGEAAARSVLAGILRGFGDNRNVSVAVVFDGRGARTELSTAESSPGFQVFYSAAGDTADAVIERFVRSSAEHYAMTIVTGDSGIRAAVLHEGADWISPLQFSDLVEAEKALLAERLRRRRRRRRPANDCR